MTASVIFKDFDSPQFWRNRFRRSGYELWDANIHYGDVRPFACPEQLCNDTLEKIYSLRDCECNGFDQDTPIVKGFCKDQHFLILANELHHVTSSELCAGTVINKLAGAPIPPTPDIDSSSCDPDSCDTTGVSYVLTYVAEHAGIQIESAPSAPTIIVPCDGHIPNVTVSWPNATGSAISYDIIGIRLYRTETTFEDGTDSIAPNGSEFVLVSEFENVNGDTFLDNVPSASTGGPLTTYEPMAFPAPRGNLIALARTTDGIAVAEANRVFISISGQPHFTFDGVVEIEDNILEMVAINNTLFVLTDGRPVKLAYRHTDGVMSIDKQVVEKKLPLRSIKSVSVYDSKVFFSTTYSLYAWDIGGYGSDIGSALTPMITPEQWSNINPDTVVGTAYEFGYILSSSNINYSLLIEFKGGRTDLTGGVTIIPISYINNVTAFGLNQDGHIMFSNNQGTYRWDWTRNSSGEFEIYDNVIPDKADICDCCPWSIKMYFDNEGKNRFSKVRVEWDERSAAELIANFYLFAFGKEELIAGPLSVVSSRGFSIPKYCSSQTFCIEVSGCGIMHEIRMATSNQELVSNSNNLIGNSEE